MSPTTPWRSEPLRRELRQARGSSDGGRADGGSTADRAARLIEGLICVKSCSRGAVEQSSARPRRLCSL